MQSQISEENRFLFLAQKSTTTDILTFMLEIFPFTFVLYVRINIPIHSCMFDEIFLVLSFLVYGQISQEGKTVVQS